MRIYFISQISATLDFVPVIITLCQPSKLLVLADFLLTTESILAKDYFYNCRKAGSLEKNYSLFWELLVKLMII